MSDQKRMTKAQRGYWMMRESAGKVENLLSSDLFRVARAINPELKDFQPRYTIFEETRWLDCKLTGSLQVLTTMSASYQFRMERAFAFWSEDFRDESSRSLSVRLHFVYEFEGRLGEQSLRVYLDCRTGLPVVFDVQRENREAHCSAERKKELADFESRVLATARAELGKIEAEKCYSLFWQIDNQSSTIDQHVEVLQELKRPHSKAEWKVAREIAWKYFPSDPPREVAA